MSGQRSIFAFCFQARRLALLVKRMTNDESNALIFSEMAFSNILEGMVLKHFSWGKRQTQVFLPLYFDTSYGPFCIIQ